MLFFVNAFEPGKINFEKLKTFKKLMCTHNKCIFTLYRHEKQLLPLQAQIKKGKYLLKYFPLSCQLSNYQYLNVIFEYITFSANLQF